MCSQGSPEPSEVVAGGGEVSQLDVAVEAAQLEHARRDRREGAGHGANRIAHARLALQRHAELMTLVRVLDVRDAEDEAVQSRRCEQCSTLSNLLCSYGGAMSCLGDMVRATTLEPWVGLWIGLFGQLAFLVCHR